MLKIKARCKYSAGTRKAQLNPDSLIPDSKNHTVVAEQPTGTRARTLHSFAVARLIKQAF